jgi:hypothetical protein
LYLGFYAKCLMHTPSVINVLQYHLGKRRMPKCLAAQRQCTCIAKKLWLLMMIMTLCLKMVKSTDLSADNFNDNKKMENDALVICVVIFIILVIGRQRRTRTASASNVLLHTIKFNCRITGCSIKLHVECKEGQKSVLIH